LIKLADLDSAEKLRTGDEFQLKIFSLHSSRKCNRTNHKVKFNVEASKHVGYNETAFKLGLPPAVNAMHKFLIS
jgi:hypothetical protein